MLQKMQEALGNAERNLISFIKASVWLAVLWLSNAKESPASVFISITGTRRVDG
jgi:hypothetical protein